MSQEQEGTEREWEEWEKESKSDPVVVGGWLRQNNLILGGLIGVGTVFVQPFLTAPELNLASQVCVIAFAVSIPLLAALILVNAHEKEYERLCDSRTVAIARPVALLSGVVGLAAGFWEISENAALTLIVSGIVAGGVHSAGYARLDIERQRRWRRRSVSRDGGGTGGKK